MWLGLYDTDGDVFDSDALPTELSLADFESASAEFFWFPDAGGELEIGGESLSHIKELCIRGDLVSLEPAGYVIPEPSAFAIWSLLATLGIAVGWWRRNC